MAWTVRGFNRARGDFSSPKRQDQLWNQPSILFSGYRASLLVKRPMREFSHAPPSSAEVKNEWSYTSIPPVCLHSMDRANFTYILALFYSA
jgi:hypothetical protein